MPKTLMQSVVSQLQKEWTRLEDELHRVTAALTAFGKVSCMEVDGKVLLQLAKREPFRLQGARELRPLNGRVGQRSRDKRLFQSVPAKDAPCPQPPRKRIVAAQKARWAKWRKTQKEG